MVNNSKRFTVTYKVKASSAIDFVIEVVEGGTVIASNTIPAGYSTFTDDYVTFSPSGTSIEVRVRRAGSSTLYSTVQFDEIGIAEWQSTSVTNCYYAWGSEEEYGYGFNGEEKDQEVSGNGNQYNYGFRIYNPRIARFLSVDPLFKDYPELTTYQFASNTPIQAIDLDGLEAFFVHGTNSNNLRWFIPEGSSTIDMTLIRGLFALTRSTRIDASYNWNKQVPNKNPRPDVIADPGTHSINRITNDEEDRRIAAEDLVIHVMNYRKINGIDKYDDKGNIIEIGKEVITFIGHSHGGNVAIQAAQMLYDKYKMQVDLITVNTPTYEGEKTKENPGTNPGTNPGINKHIHIWNEIDGVAGGLAGSDYYSKSGKTVNLPVDASKKYSWWEWKDAHSFDNEHMADFVSQISPTRYQADQLKK